MKKESERERERGKERGEREREKKMKEGNMKIYSSEEKEMEG